MADDLRVYMCILKTLQPGKAASQTCHAMQRISDNMNQAIYETVKLSRACELYLEWKRSPTVVCLQASEEQLQQILCETNAAQREVIFDNEGDEHVIAGALVCIGFYPSFHTRATFSKYRLF
jgi:hypothetical protein